MKHVICERKGNEAMGSGSGERSGLGVLLPFLFLGITAPEESSISVGGVGGVGWHERPSVVEPEIPQGMSVMPVCLSENMALLCVAREQRVLLDRHVLAKTILQGPPHTLVTGEQCGGTVVQGDKRENRR